MTNDLGATNYKGMAPNELLQAKHDASRSACHICEEARLLLSSLRGGPPVIARGELAQDLRDLRILVKSHFLDPSSNDFISTPSPHISYFPGPGSSVDSGSEVIVHHEDEEKSESSEQDTLNESNNAFEKEHKVDEHRVRRGSYNNSVLMNEKEDDVGPYARPFLAVIMDPRASGPHTLVALRALHRLFERKALVPSIYNDGLNYTASLEPTMKGVLACRFEQTDAIADEAVEMAIADLLFLLVDIESKSRETIKPEIIMEAFHTIFVTRNTFVHSPALRYHLEEVLMRMVRTSFSMFSSIQTQNMKYTEPEDSKKSEDENTPIHGLQIARLILEFLVNQLLHTPILTAPASISGDSSGVNSAGSDVNSEYDATRILCLRLIRCCLRTGWSHYNFTHTSKYDQEGHSIFNATLEEEKALLRIIQDDLCLALLMMGQAIWAYQDPASGAMPGILSIDVLSEICATLNNLWSITSLRNQLTPQLESIFTGFYQRALSLLRRLPIPSETSTFQANNIFDAEVEIILESLVDILCLDHTDHVEFCHSEKISYGGALTALFSTYDCNMIRSDVATSLVVELCRCCGGKIEEGGESMSIDQNPDTANSLGQSRSETLTPRQNSSFTDYTLGVQLQNRPVPAHLKELCAEALVGSIKRLFQVPDSSSNNANDTVSATNSTPSNVTTSVENTGSTSIHASTNESAIGSDLPPDLGNDSLSVDIERPSMLENLSHSSLEHDHMPTSPSTKVGKSTGTPTSKSRRFIKHQKRLFRKAASIFNKKSSAGIRFLVDENVISSPATPMAVASFLRNALVVGLDKRAVGEYLGAMGKSEMAGKSPPNWEMDWFHKETLSSYCSLFRFEYQSLLECLRMFLAAFRLPGEAQQIDRILQAFADSCSRVCDESSSPLGKLKLFSKDEKKASDAAYLLSFSIIMLNTDLHNENIRPDRKMTARDFIKNNTNYGKDITDPGNEFPSDFLEGIYESIREEPIRTEGEGADGVMTIERWKDVLRNSVVSKRDSDYFDGQIDDFKELILENVWLPVLSAIGGLWVKPHQYDSPETKSRSRLLVAQDARLGMDLAKEMLTGVRNLTRIDIFQQIFARICMFTGLLGDYMMNSVERTDIFIHSVERQSAVIIAIHTAIEAGDMIGLYGWKCVWALIFELRDLKLLDGSGKNQTNKSLIAEYDQDLLTPESRSQWLSILQKECFNALGGDSDGTENDERKPGFFGTVGRALFGSDTEVKSKRKNESDLSSNDPPCQRTIHGKEELVIWDDLPESDIEDEEVNENDEIESMNESGNDDSRQRQYFEYPRMIPSSAGATFEHQLMKESQLNDLSGPPVTGLETLEDTKKFHLSHRARVRRRLALSCDFSSLVLETRFLDVEGIHNLLNALVELIQQIGNKENQSYTLDRSNSLDLSLSSNLRPTTSIEFSGNLEKLRLSENTSFNVPLSPASEALAEVLICEIALRNRDRISSLWKSILRQHYHHRLSKQTNLHQSLKRQMTEPDISSTQNNSSLGDVGMEKCVTGLLRLCYSTLHRVDIVNDVLETLALLVPPKGGLLLSSSSLTLDKHLAEGLWRICRNVDDLRDINHGWNGILGLMEWCAMKGEQIYPRNVGRNNNLSEDDPALQAFRSIHLLLHSEILKNVVPLKVVHCIRALISGGEKQQCPKLSIAGLDLLLLLHTRLQRPTPCAILNLESSDTGVPKFGDDNKLNFWVPVLQGISEAGESNFSNVRQHAISMLTDAVTDKNGLHIPEDQLCRILTGICVPLAGNRINELLRSDDIGEIHIEEVMIELEQCVSLVFKPFVHFLKRLTLVPNELTAIWISMLAVMAQLLGEDSIDEEDESENDISSVSKNGSMTRNKLLNTTKELASEHLRNAVMVLVEENILCSEVEVVDKTDQDLTKAQNITSLTWSSIENMQYCRKYISEWKASAKVSSQNKWI